MLFSEYVLSIENSWTSSLPKLTLRPVFRPCSEEGIEIVVLEGLFGDLRILFGCRFI